MNLGETWIGEKGPFSKSSVSGGHIGSHGIGREEKYVPVTARAQNDCMGFMTFDVPADQVADHNSSGIGVDDHQFQHFTPCKKLTFSRGGLTGEGAVGAQQKLLPGLPPGVKSAGDLSPAK